LPFECHFDRGGIDPQPIISQVEASTKKKPKTSSVPSPGKFIFCSTLVNHTYSNVKSLRFEQLAGLVPTSRLRFCLDGWLRRRLPCVSTVVVIQPSRLSPSTAADASSFKHR
jgi:hypothetical protein